MHQLPPTSACIAFMPMSVSRTTHRTPFSRARGRCVCNECQSFGCRVRTAGAGCNDAKHVFVFMCESCRLAGCNECNHSIALCARPERVAMVQTCMCFSCVKAAGMRAAMNAIIRLPCARAAGASCNGAKTNVCVLQIF